MWYETLELNTARCLEQNDCVSCEPALELRPKVLDVQRGNYSLVFELLQRRGELADARDDLRTGRQCQTGDVRVALS